MPEPEQQSLSERSPKYRTGKAKSFANYKAEGAKWITLATGEYYPDILPAACELYKPVLVMFGQLLKSSESSERLLKLMDDVSNGWMRVQLARVFRKYVSPSTPVEMLKVKSRLKQIIDEFGADFRPIQEVQAAFESRPLPDEALCAVLWEYKDRGKKGYDLTERFFDMVRSLLPELTIHGPERAGRDVSMGTVFKNYPNPTRPVDFVIHEKSGKKEVLAIGLARYDSDRGGEQEDDRPGQYRSAVDEILGYAHKHGLKAKVVLLNDGPGLLLGTMWNDYIKLEESYKGEVLVVTLRMIPERLTLAWLRSSPKKE